MRRLVTLFAATALVLVGSFSWAQDNRYRVTLSKIESQGSVYGIYKIEICPQCWDGELRQDHEVLRFHAVIHVLEQVQTFLKKVHTENALKSENKVSKMTQFILESFSHYPDPFGRIQWSDSSRPLRKVDDYLNHQSLILVIAKDGDLKPENIVGTAKFLVSTPERLQAPLIHQYLGFLPLPMGDPTAISDGHIDVEYENLARSAKGPNPVPLLLQLAIQSDFFKKLEGKNSRIHLNSVQSLVDYHRRFGFEPIDGYYPDLPASRLSTETASFVNHARRFVSERLDANHPNILTPTNEPIPILWESSGHLATNALSFVAREGFQSIFCRVLLTGRGP